MSDNSFGTTFGPSSPGAINLVAGNTGGVDMANREDRRSRPPTAQRRRHPMAHGGYTLTTDAQPYYDDCSTRDAVALTGKNVGDELNAAGLSWGWFEGGFRPTTSFTTPPRPAAAGQPTATFIPDEFKGKFAGEVRTSRPGPVQRRTPVGAGSAAPADDRAPGTTATRTTTSRTTSRSSTTPRPPTRTTSPPADASRHAIAHIGNTQHHVSGVPQFDTAEPPVRHERLRPAGRSDRRTAISPDPRSRRSAS